MDEYPALVLAWLAGLGLGSIFFGGLWWSVSKGLGSRRPVLWLFGSLLVRMSIVLTGLYFVGYEHWQRLVACLVGIVMARLAVTWFIQSPGQTGRAQEANHAP